MDDDVKFLAYCRRLRQNDPDIRETECPRHIDAGSAYRQILIRNGFLYADVEDQSDSVEKFQHLIESLYENTMVEKLTVRLCHMRHHGMVALAQLLERNVTLKELEVICRGLTDLPEEEGYSMFAEALGRCHLQRVELRQDNDAVENGGFFHSFCNGLAQNTTIQELLIKERDMKDDDALALGNALKANNSLQSLVLDGSRSEVGTDHIWNSMEQNSTITYLQVGRLKLTTSMNVLAMNNMLKKNTSIKSVHLHGYYVIETEAKQSFVRTLIEDNFTLDEFHLTPCYISYHEDITYLLDTIGYLNENGSRRKLLEGTNDVPVGLWAYVFASTSKIGKCPDVLFHLVKSKPELFQF